MLRYMSFLLAVLGICGAIYVVATAKDEIPNPPPAQPPSVNPYRNGLVALGLVEPASRMVDVAAPEAGRVVSVLARVNDQVKKGDPLFVMDPVPLEAELVRARGALEAAKAELQRTQSWPRAEDVPPVEAEVAEARERLADSINRLKNMEAAGERGAASDDELQRQRFNASVLRSMLANAEARLARLKAGSWNQDVLVAQSQVAAREADIRAIELRLERLTVRAPLDATVLQRNIEPGEFAQSQAPGGGGSNSEAPLVLGDLTTMHVRAQVDEEDTPLLRMGAQAVARIRGPVATEIPLRMLRIEPMARPKTQISGASTELVDTRVIETVFEAQATPGARLFPGQVVDVYIDAEPASDAAPPSSAPGPQG